MWSNRLNASRPEIGVAGRGISFHPTTWHCKAGCWAKEYLMLGLASLHKRKVHWHFSPNRSARFGVASGFGAVRFAIQSIESKDRTGEEAVQQGLDDLANGHRVKAWTVVDDYRGGRCRSSPTCTPTLNMSGGPRSAQRRSAESRSAESVRSSATTGDGVRRRVTRTWAMQNRVELRFNRPGKAAQML
jgi:hypothetical protein